MPHGVEQAIEITQLTEIRCGEILKKLSERGVSHLYFLDGRPLYALRKSDEADRGFMEDTRSNPPKKVSLVGLNADEARRLLQLYVQKLNKKDPITYVLDSLIY